MKKAEAKLADLKKEMWRTESEKQGDCLSIEYGNLMEMQLSWLGPCSFPSEYLKSSTSGEKRQLFLVLY